MNRYKSKLIMGASAISLAAAAFPASAQNAAGSPATAQQQKPAGDAAQGTHRSAAKGSILVSVMPPISAGSWRP